MRGPGKTPQCASASPGCVPAVAGRGMSREVTAPPHPRTGALLSLASAALAAIFLIPYQLATERAPAEVVTMTMLACAAVFNTLTSAGDKLRAARARARGQGRDQAGPGRSLGMTLVISAVIAVLTAAGNYAVARALTSAAPGLVSVVQQTQVVFIAAISALLLGERITLRFGVGVVVVLAGFMVMSLPGGQDAGQDAGQSAGMPLGALWALLSAACFGSMHVITRMEIHRIDPVLVNAIRLWFAVALLLPGRLDGALALDGVTWALVAGAAFLGPFLGRLALMFAVRHISASRSALLIQAGPVFAFLFGFAILGIVPALRELLGGALILAGIALPLLERAAAAGPPVAEVPPVIATGDAAPTTLAVPAVPAAPLDPPAESDSPVTGRR
jgi:drug/metabolite transporter (DMT)-like permease